jgi:hypothetical protein
VIASRRTALRGLGVALALPSLETLARGARRAPLRMAFLAVPNGVDVDRWRPTGTGRQFQLGPSLAPLAPWQGKLQLFTGFAQKNAEALGDGAGDHARANAAFLTGCHPRKTAGANLRNGISVDQVAAQSVGHLTRLPSLELIGVRTRQSGACDSGYSCAYQYNLSWASETMPMPPEADPRQVFERLFGAGPPGERQRGYLLRQRQRRSLLDFVRDDIQALGPRLDPGDRGRLDEYLTGLREVEREIEHAEGHRLPSTTLRAPEALPEDFGKQLRLLSTLLALAFQTDSTRIATLLLANEGNNRSFTEIGIGEGHHNLSHHQGREETLDKLARIDRFYVEQLAHLLRRLAAAQDSDGRSVLDNTMILYGGGIADGNKHSHDHLPILLAGGAGRSSPPSRHLELPGELPLANLFLGMLDRMGVHHQALGDSTGVFDDF